MIIWVLIGLSGTINLFLALTVLMNNYKRRVNIAFAVFATISSVWSLSNLLLIFYPSTLLLKIAYALGAIVMGSSITWLLTMLEAKRTWIYVVLSSSIIFGVLSFTNLFVVDLRSMQNSIPSISYGGFFNAYSVFMAASLITALSLSYYGLRKNKGFLKTQYQLIFTGALIYGTLSLMVSFVLPLFGFDRFVMLDSPSSLFLIGFSTYAIIRHKLMDIRAVVARSVAYILLIATLAAIYAVTILGIEFLFFPEQINTFNLAQGALRTVVAVVMVFLFQPLKTWITNATDKIFYKSGYDADELLAQLSNTLGSTIVLVELLYKVGDIITKEMKVSRALFALTRDDSKLYTVQANGYTKTPDVDPRDVSKLTRDGIVHADDLEEGSRLKHLMGEYQSSLAIPLKTEKEVVGVMLLGEKSSGDMYSQQDISVLEILAPEMAVAIENAKSYEEISRFNTTLRQEVKRATYRLKQKNEQLMELDHAKDEFISMASHQLRTPLTAIKGYLSMLLEGDAGDIKVSQYDFINEAYSGANRMVGLINDLLNVSRMDTGRFFLEAKDVDIERVVNEEMKQLSNSAKAKGLYLKLDAKGRIPHIWADETKIRQVVMNFMDNAIYYTNTGGVTVVIKHDKDNFIYEVHDTGIGVPKNQRDHMFEKFFRADNARTARPDGTGLGIYLAKRVVLDHGGEIIFDSTEGKGSIFGFKFPLKKVATAKMASAPAPRPAGTVPAMPTATDIAAKSE